MLDFNDDWPDVACDFDFMDQANLESWLAASPKRTRLGDTLWLARRYSGSGMSPPSPGQAGVPGIGIIQPQMTSYVIFDQRVTIHALEVEDRHLVLNLEVAAPLAETLGLTAGEPIKPRLPPDDMTGYWLVEPEVALPRILWNGGIQTRAIQEILEKLRREENAKEVARERYRRLCMREIAHQEHLGLPNHLRRRFDEILATHGLTEFAEPLAAMALPIINIETAEEVPTRVGASRFGGRPDLSPGSVWPNEEGNHYTFVGQIDLAELPYVPPPLPRRGLMSFFSGDCDSASDPGGRVLYSQGPLQTLDMPDEDSFLDEYQEGVVARGMKFSLSFSLPTDAAELLDLPPEQRDDISDELTELGLTLSGRDLLTSGLMGHVTIDDLNDHLSFNSFKREDTRQWSAIELAQKADGDPQWRQRQMDHTWWLENMGVVARKRHRWINLLRVESHMECNLCWWDAGYFSYVIHIDKLKDLDLENIRTYIFSL